MKNELIILVYQQMNRKKVGIKQANVEVFVVKIVNQILIIFRLFLNMCRIIYYYKDIKLYFYGYLKLFL